MSKTVTKKPVTSTVQKAAANKPSTLQKTLSKKASPGHSLKADPDAPSSWRCPVCTFVNPPVRDACSKCREPMTDELKKLHSVNKEKPMRTVGDGHFSVPVASSAPKPVNSVANVPEKKANIHGVVQSKLNHDTAAYRGHFADPNAPAVKVHTLANSTKNGFISSSKPAVKTEKSENAWEAHQNKPLKKFSGGSEFSAKSKGSSTIDMLQGACSSNQAAMLKHTGVTVKSEQKPMGNEMTKYEM